jgi:hypothetical protein
VNGYINGFSLNGAAYPSWVIRAVVAAVAAATFTVAQTRTTFASAFGDAVVSVHLTQTHTIQARASASASATVDVTPTLKYAGHSNATATAFGAGAVRRDVFGFAGGDATCTGEALTAQAIGEASATSASSVVRSDAHIVFFGRALTPCTATGTAAGKVTRYPTVLAGWGEVLYRRGEASVKRSGHSYYEHDGYVLLAKAGATGAVPQDRVKIIATLGSFDYCDSTGAARSFVKFSARALGTGVCTGLQATAIHNHRPRVTVQATASATVVGTRTVLPVATATATATAYALKGQIIHASTGSATAQATVLSASALRTAKGYTEVWAYANVAKPIENGVQYRSTVLVSANGTGTAAAKQRHAGLVNVSAQALSARATATHNQAGHVSDALASATVGRAYGLTNSEVPAPDDRSMSVPAEDRGMTVFAEERTMVVTA